MQNARVPKFSHLNPTSNSSKKAQRKHILLQNILISHTHLTLHFPAVQSSAYLYGSGCKLLTSQDAHKRNLAGLGWGCWHHQDLSSRNGFFSLWEGLCCVTRVLNMSCPGTTSSKANNSLQEIFILVHCSKPAQALPSLGFLSAQVPSFWLRFGKELNVDFTIISVAFPPEDDISAHHYGKFS